jgi:hypothetical protein|tara:strand:- start:350 stop:577 length:228 start_codon:yes stop_codon:yes gene_type:complete
MDNEQPNIEITPNDLVVIRQVMDIATQSGAFKAADLTTVGTVYDKVNGIVESLIAQQNAAKDNDVESVDAEVVKE